VPTPIIEMLEIGIVREGVVKTRRSMRSAVKVFVAAALSFIRPEKIMFQKGPLIGSANRSSAGT
jgi:hypothetical protein